jgi:hypothetical protein
MRMMPLPVYEVAPRSNFPVLKSEAWVSISEKVRMKRYNSIEEMEADQKQQRRKENKAIIAAMTDSELSAIIASYTEK